MGEGGSDTAAVKIDDASAQTAGEDDAPVEGIVPLRIEQAETLQEIARISLRGEMATQVPARGVTDAQFSDQGGIVQSALLQIAQRLRVAIELWLARAPQQGQWEERFAARGRRGFGGKTDDETTGQSESDRRPGHNHDSRRDFCGR
jgi:hypothetical protein